MQTDIAFGNVANHLIADIFSSHFDVQTRAQQFEMEQIQELTTTSTSNISELSRRLKRGKNSGTFKNFPGGVETTREKVGTRWRAD